MPVIVFLSMVVMTVVAFPPFEVPEFAYACVAPAVLWAYRWPSFKTFAAVTVGAQVVSWYFLLWWLHHATWPGYVLLPLITGLWVGSWFILVWWMVPRLRGLRTVNRLAGVLALAAAWVLIEWTRTWVLTGFPWLPLAASQWERSSILQVASYTGAGGISFFLILMNLGFAAYAHRLFFEKELTGLQKRSQEFLLAIFGLLVCLSIHVQESVNRYHFREPLGRFGLVQPNVPQELKWNPAHGPQIVDTLETATAAAARRAPDLILWPEAVTPWAILNDEDQSVREFVEHVAMENRTPILLGSIGIEPPLDGATAERWRNGAFLVDPGHGLEPNFYAKRHLVPFGEYVPLRWALGWLDKIVPVGGDFIPGDSGAPFLVNANDLTFGVGSLICYEDVFPSLARDSVRENADLLVVLTNDGWYGEGAMPFQHAAHSVLRAVETRRPVLRVGNAGWSGWIDEFGVTRAVLRRVTRVDAEGRRRQVVSTKIEDRQGSIFFRGSGIIDVTRDSRWVGRQSFYVSHGDWFILLCVGLFVGGWMLVKMGRPAAKAS